ncbi:response regulator transcription factor [Corynebacterium cystitidis]|uniref:response regulator transcription factor n=1 Tax=Corynebacterium cystitidis TaxID=35757 RepID=UPI0018D4F867
MPTKREAQVLNLLLEGLSNQGIAKELNVTEAAVKKHVANLLVKYRVPLLLQL